MKKYTVKKKKYRHSGETDPYWAYVDVVEAESLAEVPFVFAAEKGFGRSSVTRWFDTKFDIGGDSYLISPAD